MPAIVCNENAINYFATFPIKNLQQHQQRQQQKSKVTSMTLSKDSSKSVGTSSVVVLKKWDFNDVKFCFQWWKTHGIRNNSKYIMA